MRQASLGNIEYARSPEAKAVSNALNWQLPFAELGAKVRGAQEAPFAK